MTGRPPRDPPARATKGAARFHVPGGGAELVLVTNDADSCRELTEDLRCAGWAVVPHEPAAARMLPAVAAASEACGASRASKGPRVVLVDLTVDDHDVARLAAGARSWGPAAPTLVLTTLSAAERRVGSLPVATHDFALTPVAPRELRLRLSRLAGGAQKRSDPRMLAVGDLVMEDVARSVMSNGREVALTRTEYELLHYLMLHPGRVLSKGQILDAVWPDDADRGDDRVVLFVSYLRRKLRAHEGRTVIHTVRGTGYVLRPIRPVARGA